MVCSSNDTDEENDPLSAQIGSLPSHGSLEFNSDGSFRYTPEAGFSGPDSFTYRASDGQAVSSLVTVNIIVNDPPVVSSTNLFVSPQVIDEGGFVEVTGTFSDPNTQPHTVTINWGDGTTPDTISLAAGVGTIPVTRHTYADNPSGGTTYRITVTVSDGFTSSAGSLDVTVNNVLPVVAPALNVTINQGDTFGGTGSFLDPAPTRGQRRWITATVRECNHSP